MGSCHSDSINQEKLIIKVNLTFDGFLCSPLFD